MCLLFCVVLLILLIFVLCASGSSYVQVLYKDLLVLHYFFCHLLCLQETILVDPFDFVLCASGSYYVQVFYKDLLVLHYYFLSSFMATED